jgi:hypothetical protein
VIFNLDAARLAAMALGAVTVPLGVAVDVLDAACWSAGRATQALSRDATETGHW